MRRETRYTLAGFVVFIYSFAFLVLLMISFQCRGNRLSAVICTAIIATLASYFVNTHPKGIRLYIRTALIMVFSTILIILCWLLLCEGTFKPLV